MRFFLATCLLLVIGCSDDKSEVVTSSDSTQDKTISDSRNEWTYRSVQIDDKGWGYQLFKGAWKKIDQRNIPSVSGLHYFESEEKAELAAEFALEKVKQGYFPPSVNPAELDSIGAINLDSLLLVNEQLMK